MVSTMQQDLYETFARALAGLCPLERVRELEAAADPRAGAARAWNEVDALERADGCAPRRDDDYGIWMDGHDG
ncbi:acyl-CoA dehydrogenase, partial [Bordetella bronchiseptica]